MVVAMVATRAGKMAADLALSYGVGAVTNKALSSFFDSHVGAMKSSENEMIARTGRVLEAVTIGYGVGYIAPVAVIAAGQLILGNPLGAVASVGTAAIGLNPAAASCAAMGAIYFGYNALNEREKEEFLNKLEVGLDVGREFIKSIIGFAISTLSSMLNSELVKQLRSYVVEYANLFGTSIATITKSLSDSVIVGVNNAVVAATALSDSVGSKLATAATGARSMTSTTTAQMSDYAVEASKKASAAISNVYSLISKIKNSKNDVDIEKK